VTDPLIVKSTRTTPNFFDINFGTIQGSILGPLLFALFISPLADILHQQLMQMTTTSLVVEKQRKKRWKIASKRPKLQ
jgi:hypothetical protein